MQEEEREKDSSQCDSWERDRTCLPAPWAEGEKEQVHQSGRQLPAAQKQSHTETDRPPSFTAPEEVEREDWPPAGTVPPFILQSYLMWFSTAFYLFVCLFFCRWVSRSFICGFTPILWLSSDRALLSCRGLVCFPFRRSFLASKDGEAVRERQGADTRQLGEPGQKQSSTRGDHVLQVIQFYMFSMFSRICFVNL